MKPSHLPNPFHSKLLKPVAMIGAGMIGFSANSKAATNLWTGAVNGNWNTTDANWNNGGTNLYTSGDIVQFGDTGGANLTINITAAVTPASVSFTDTGAGINAYIFNGSAINGTGTTVSLDSGFGGSVRFNVANGYTGATTLTSGTLQVANSAALGTGAITLAGGSLQSAGTGVKTLANSSIVATASTTTSLAAVGGDLVLSGALTGSGNISINNATAGSFKLSGNLSGYTGTISYNNVVNGNNFFVAGGAGGTDLSNAKLVLSGSTVAGARRFGGDTATAGIVQIGELSGQGVIGASNNGNTTYQIGKLNTDSTLNATIVNVGTGVASITKVGTGTLALGGANTNTGAYTVNAGTLQFAKTASLYNSATGSWTAANIRAASGATVAFNVGGTGEFTTGNVTTLLGNLAASSSSTNGMNAGSSIGFDTTNAGGSFTITDVIANTTGASGGSRGLVKLGSGTLNLSNTNTYTGVTAIRGGTLKLASTGSIASSSVIANNAVFDVSDVSGYAVGATQTLTGSGTVIGNVTIAGNLAIGNSPGAIVFQNDLTLQGVATMELGGSAVAGTDYDYGNVLGTLTLGGALAIISSGGYDLTQAAAYNLFDAATFSGDFATVSVGGFGLTYSPGSDSWNGISGEITYAFTESNGVLTVIPEPAAALLGGIGLLTLLRRKRQVSAR